MTKTNSNFDEDQLNALSYVDDAARLVHYISEYNFAVEEGVHYLVASIEQNLKDLRRAIDALERPA